MQAGSLRRARAALMVAVLVASSLTAATALREEPASAAVTPKTALVYGDSLVWEAAWKVKQQFNTKKGWTYRIHSFPSTASCNWLAWLPADLDTYHPSVVSIASAGNPYSIGASCMIDENGNPLTIDTDGYYARYRADLDAMFAMITATGAKVVWVTDPPMLSGIRNTAVLKLEAIAKELAANYHGVSVSRAVRSALAKNGKYTDYKPCLKTETAAQGCSGGQIPVRTIAEGGQRGLHLCPPGLPDTWPLLCTVYSSGEFRFGRALANTTAAPPKPVLP